MAGPRFIPGLSRSNVLREALAGLTLLAISVPLNIGYAQIAGLPVTAGLYALIVPSIAYALLASSRQLVVAPDAAGAALIASSLSGVVAAGTAGYAVMAAAQAVLGGALFLLAARFRLGFIADFLSAPILVGFIAGLAFEILLSQLAKMLGIHIEGEFFEKLADLFVGFGSLSVPSLILSGSCLVVLLVGRQFARNIPWALLVMVAATTVSSLSGLSHYGVAVLGDIPAGLPVFAIPHLSVHGWLLLLPSALALTAVTTAEGLMIARSYAEKNNADHQPNKDLAALGIANIAAGVTSSFSVGASTSRTAAMDSAGARTQLPSLILAAGATLLLLFGTSLLASIPMPAIGAIVTVAILRLLGISEIVSLRKRSRSEFSIALACLLGVLIAGPLNGLLLAFVFSLINLARRVARPAVVILAEPDDPTESLLESDTIIGSTAPGIRVYRLHAPIFFGNAAAIAAQLSGTKDEQGRPLDTVVIDMSGVSDADITGAEQFARAVTKLRKHGIVVAMTRIRPDLAARLHKLGVPAPDAQFATNRAALEHFKNVKTRDPLGDTPQ